jgi:PIN domain nuclease of toxin-antitoxin system
MNVPILDTSALLALLWQEAGWERVADALDVTGCRMSAVNVAEFVGKAQENQADTEKIAALLAGLPIEIVAYDRRQAIATGGLRMATRHLGLSLGDRACLALARQEKAPVLTADRAWLTLAQPLGVDIRCIRPDAP